MKKNEDEIQWKGVLRKLYNYLPSENETKEFHAKDAHPLLFECGYSSKEWPVFVKALKFLILHGLTEASFELNGIEIDNKRDIKRVSENDVYKISDKIELTKTGFSVARELETQADNIRINKGILVLTSMLVLLVLGQFVLATALIDAIYVFAIVIVMFIMIQFLVQKRPM